MPDLLEAESFPRLLRAGRWALTLIETALSIGLIVWYPERSLNAYLSMALLLGYNVVVLALLHRAPLSQLRLWLLLTLDLLLLGNVSLWTGGAHSPFLGQSHLIILVAALFFDLPGGLLAGLAAAGMTVGMALVADPPGWEIVRDIAPYFPIVGGFTGYLVGLMKRWFARFQDQTRREESQRREMELARVVQRSSLPDAAPTVPGVEVAVRALPSQEVGGDFHVFVRDPHSSRLGIAIGDVAGKGMAAALTATSVGVLLPHLRPFDNPPATLASLSDDLLARLPAESFVTLLFVEIWPETDLATLWNAGHPPLILWRAADSRATETRSGDALPLGMLPAWKGRSQRLEIETDDVLLLVSDGVIETRDRAGEEFGMARIADVLSSHARCTATAIADALIAAVEAHGMPTDDLTVIVCRRTADPERPSSIG
jgi:hypothetical protein